MSAVWTRVARRAELAREGRLVVRPQGRQLALFDTPRGILACNNRCPHEGYPLSEGTLDGACTLTCNWHNWKFDLVTGDNHYGGDRLRTYPVELRGDEIWVDLADPPFAERRARYLENLRDAFDDNDYARMARELGRLRLLGADPLDAARAAVGWSWDRMEFGWTHGYAGLADWLELPSRYADDDEVLVTCLLEGIGHVADDVLREPVHPFPAGARDYAEDAFVAAVEGEDEAAAAAMVRGALAAGAGFADLERGLARAALAHYNAFGHSAIYVTKAARLVARLGASVAEPLLLALVRQMVYARREDLIPEFRGYAEARAIFGTGGGTPDAGAFRGLGIDKALAETVRVSVAPPRNLFDALLGANAVNLLAYDMDWQDRVRVPVADNVGWLDFTHGITFAEAAGELCDRHPDLWPDALLQMACFAGRNARYARGDPPLERWAVADAGDFFAHAIEGVLDHREDEFIVSVHRLKTLLAARSLHAQGLSPSTRAALLAGVNRYLASPVRLKQVRRTVHQALQFVARDG